MDRKRLAQIFLILIASSIIVLFVFKFYYPSEKIKKINQLSENLKKDDINLIQGIIYTSKDKNNNTYTIEAESGKADEDDPNIITLYKVSAVLKFDKKKNINVYSDTAIYNTVNNDTEFKQNVKLFHEEHNVLCDNLIVEFSKNYAILKNNLIYKNLNTKLFADKIEIDLIKRTTKTSMFDINDKITIINTDGLN